MRQELTIVTIFFVMIAISVHGIFLYKREILFDKKKFTTIFITALGLFALYHILTVLGLHSKNMGMIQVPFLALLIFFAMSYVYKKIFGENPQDSFWSMDISLMKDGVFNFLFWVIGLIVPIYLSLKVFNN